MLKCLNKVEFFRDLSDDAKHHVIYSMVGYWRYDGEELIVKGQDATSMYFLQRGEISVNTMCEHNPFCLEKLYKGSIINYRTFFQTYNNMVTLKFEKDSILFELSYEKMEKLCNLHNGMKRKFDRFKGKISFENKPYPLDYILELPKRLINKSDISKEVKCIRLENTLKNISLRMLEEVKI